MIKPILVGLVLIALAGCSKDANNSTSSKSSKETTTNNSSSSTKESASSTLEFFSEAYSLFSSSSSNDGEGVFDSLMNYWNSDGNSSSTGSDSSWFDFSSWFGSDSSASNVSLLSNLKELATSADSREQFIYDGIDYSVEYVVREYFPDFMYNTLMGLDFLKAENLVASSATLVSYMGSLYDDYFGSAAPQRAAAVATANDEESLIQLIIDEIYNIIMEWLWPSDDVVTPPVVIDPSEMIDPSIPVDFNSVGLDLKSKVFYVASATYMTITMDANENKGRGEIGFGVGEDFTYTVNSDGTLDIDMAGIYKVDMTYYDPNYCVAVTMLDTETDETYDAYWFFDEDVYNKASNMKLAEQTCFIRKKGYSAPVVAKDGKLEPIKDERAGHSPVSGSTTADVVSTLVNGVSNTANITDAKYFARKMRHGVFSIYTTNGQTDTLQARETEKIKRELLPLVAASTLDLETLMTSAYDGSIAFQSEVNRDLDASFTEINGRLDELINAISVAIENTSTTQDGRATTPTYGDKVVIHAVVTGVNFFQNQGTADVTMTITNPADNGRNASIVFTTEVTGKAFGSGDISFDEISAGQSNNYLSGSEYKLNVKTFNYKKSDGIMNFSGDGYLGVTSKFNVSNYVIKALFPYDTLTLESVTATVDGKITTAAGRVFDGTLIFDGADSSNSQMDGTLVGVNNEPTITGLVKTSLNTDDITQWYTSTNTTEQVVNNLGDQSYSMNVQLTSKDSKQTASTNMLARRDTAEDKWYYNLQNLNVTDTHGSMKADSIYFVQNGSTTISETIDKLIQSGINLDADLNSMINLGWDIASDFSEIGIENLQVVMKPASGDVTVKSTIHMNNLGATMSADAVTTYDYDTTHLSSTGDFTTVVDASSGKNVYSNTFTMKGSIKEDLKFNYLYEIDYTDDRQYILFTREDSTYQMGFVLTNSEILGGDSYGVKAKFFMNDTYDVMEGMELRNIDDTPLGIYNRSEDPLQINFLDGVKEYMYLY